MNSGRRDEELSGPNLFRIKGDTVVKLTPRSLTDERSLQRLFEFHLRKLLEVNLLATEYATGSRHGGRIDTLRIDDQATPVFIEYKRRTTNNLINQGPFYLDWLHDHRAEFHLLLQQRFGSRPPGSVSWMAPRLICIAPRFHRYDSCAVRQITRRIELVRYRWFGRDLLLLFKEVAE